MEEFNRLASIGSGGHRGRHRNGGGGGAGSDYTSDLAILRDSDRARLAFARLSQPAHLLLCVASSAIAHTAAAENIATAAGQES